MTPARQAAGGGREEQVHAGLPSPPPLSYCQLGSCSGTGQRAARGPLYQRPPASTPQQQLVAWGLRDNSRGGRGRTPGAGPPGLQQQPAAAVPGNVRSPCRQGAGQGVATQCNRAAAAAQQLLWGGGCWEGELVGVTLE